VIETEVLIVGGGPGGSACAWRLKQHKIPCIVLDQEDFPRFKPCAGWITPEVVRDLGLKPGEYPHGFVTFTSLRVVINDFKLRLPTRQHAIRRVEFDHWLLERSGAPFYRHAVKTIREIDGAYVVDDRFRARYLVGAGGTYCPVYRTLFKTASPKARAALIAAQEDEFPCEWDQADCWLWFKKDLPGYAWYVPKGNGYVNVGVGAWAEKLKASGASLKEHWERLVDDVDRLGLVRGHAYQPVAHSYYLRQRLPAIRSGNAFIVGDSAGLATLDMGEGIGPAIRSGMRAADAIATGQPYSLDGIASYSQGPLLGQAVKGLYRIINRG
jgi:flavin-dependent dehydrogenase